MFDFFDILKKVNVTFHLVATLQNATDKLKQSGRKGTI